jgi:paraquat-inducible protein B
MSQDNSEVLPEAVVQTKSRFSVVWLIPLVAAMIGGWLVYKTISEKGPTISIKLKNAAGLEPGKTKVKYRAVEMGMVKNVSFSKNLSHVIVTAEMDKNAEPHLTQGAKFWVVRPRISATNITGLDTLVSGSYIEFEPGSGNPTLQFAGLENPPVIKLDEPGRKFLLKSESLGSLGTGSVIYYREIQVGNVLGYKMAEDNKSVNVHILIKAPHDQLIKKSTKFWNISGIDVSVDADGIKVKTQSLEALIGGGVAFETPLEIKEEKPVKEDFVFKLFKNYKATQETFTEQARFIMYFDGSVRGLKIGAPVEFKGIRVGTVKEIRMEVDGDTMAIRIPVIIAIEPERIKRIGKKSGPKRNIPLLIKKGLKARLQTGSLLTGQLLVELDLYPSIPVKLTGGNISHVEIPTIPSALDEVTESAVEILADIKNLPLDELVVNLISAIQGVNQLVRSDDLTDSVANLNESLKSFHKLTSNMDKKLDVITEEISATSLVARNSIEGVEGDLEKNLSKTGDSLNLTLKEVRTLVKDVNSKVEPLATDLKRTLGATQSTLLQGEKALGKAENLISTGSPLRYELDNTLKEISAASRSIRILSDYLARHPDALIYGKTGAGTR